MNGKNIVLTGIFTEIKRSEAAAQLKVMGASIGSGVTKKTDILFVGDRPGSKLAKAEALGIQVLGEADLMAVLRGDSELSITATPPTTIHSKMPLEQVTEQAARGLDTPVAPPEQDMSLPFWTEVPYTAPTLEPKTPPLSTHETILKLLKKTESPVSWGALGIPIGNSARLWAHPNGVHLFRQRGERYVLLDSLERGGRSCVFSSHSSVAGLLNSDSKDQHWVYLISIKGGSLHYNTKMKVTAHLTNDWRDTELSEENGHIIMRTTASADEQRQWVLQNLEVVSHKHAIEKQQKKALRDLAKSVKLNGGMGLVPSIDAVALPKHTVHNQIAKVPDGPALWTGQDGHTWEFVPYLGERYPKAVHGTYLLEYLRPDGTRVPIDLGVTEGIREGYPRLCGDYLPRIGIAYNHQQRREVDKWDHRVELIEAVLGNMRAALYEGFYAHVFDNHSKALIFSMPAGMAFEVDLNTGSSRVIDVGMSQYQRQRRGRVLEMGVRSDRSFLIRFESCVCSGHLDKPLDLKLGWGRSLRVHPNIFVMYGADEPLSLRPEAQLSFFMEYDMPTYAGMTWIDGKHVACRHLLSWHQFSLPFSGLELTMPNDTLYAVDETRCFKFEGLSAAIEFLTTTWVHADRDTAPTPDLGWNF